MDRSERSAFDGHPERESVDTDEEPTVTRRQALGAVGGIGLLGGAGKALDNVVLGYGVLVGTNLIEQDLGTLVDERFGPTTTGWRTDQYRLRYRDGRLTVMDADNRLVTRLPITDTTPTQAAEWDDRLGLTSGPLEELSRDLSAIAAGNYRFEFGKTDSFFETAADGTARPYTVGAIRGNRFRRPAPDLIERFTDADPADPAAVIAGLKTGFREYSGYDMPRYAAGSIQDNVLFDAIDLRAPFQSPTDFESIIAGENTGLFCYEFAYRSIEALHAVAPIRQRLPVAGAVVTDSRHKHVYTGVASAVRRDGELVFPMTFVDYTHATLYDDLAMRGILGEGLEAYNRRHRTDNVFWNRYARWR